MVQDPLSHLRAAVLTGAGAAEAAQKLHTGSRSLDTLHLVCRRFCTPRANEMGCTEQSESAYANKSSNAALPKAFKTLRPEIQVSTEVSTSEQPPPLTQS